MYLSFRKRKRRIAIIIVRIAIIMAVIITLLTVYKSHKSVTRKLRRYTKDTLSGEEMIALVGVEACKPSPHNNETAEFDMFNVYREQVAQHGATPSQRWLQTFDSYSKETDAILDNMCNFMISHVNMTFMWAELAFFERWWRKQDYEVRENVRRLVQYGRLEIASGSWVMTDEANVYFPITVDNIVEGHQFLKKELDHLLEMVQTVYTAYTHHCDQVLPFKYMDPSNGEQYVFAC